MRSATKQTWCFAAIALFVGSLALGVSSALSQAPERRPQATDREVLDLARQQELDQLRRIVGRFVSEQADVYVGEIEARHRGEGLTEVRLPTTRVVAALDRSPREDSRSTAALTIVSPTHGLWLRLSQSSASPAATYSSDVFDWPIVAIHMSLLHTGHILIWSHKGAGEEAHLLDPTENCFDVADGCFTAKPNPVNLFCAGQTHLDDGSLIVNGGHIRNHVGEPNTFLFQYDKEAQDWNWTQVGEIADTSYARWYPSLTTLPDGRVLNVSGSEKRCSSGPNMDNLCQVHADCAPVEEENCTARAVAIPELFDPATRKWTRLNEITQSVQFYPFNFVDPDGNVFFAGADKGLSVSSLDISPKEAATFNVTGAGLSVSGMMSATDGGSAVMYQPGRILKCGGTNGLSGAIADAETVDLNAGAQWHPTNPMNIPRRRHNLTVLPDGTVLATGGTRLANKEFEIERTCGGTDDGAECSNNDDCPANLMCLKHSMGEQLWVAEAELWDPQAGLWTFMAGSQRPRMYHSTALLLPDGRVISAGGGRGGGAVNNYPDAQVFSPPYLFTGTSRPLIEQATEISITPKVLVSSRQKQPTWTR